MIGIERSRRHWEKDTSWLLEEGGWGTSPANGQDHFSSHEGLSPGRVPKNIRTLLAMLPKTVKALSLP